MPNSVYYTSPAALASPEKKPWRFTAALARACAWIQAHPASEVAPLLKKQWPGLDQGILIEVVDDLRSTGLWADVRIDRGSYDEWMEMLAEEGLTTSPVPYDDLVDPRPADEAVEALTEKGAA
jgi:NitT/TauT family transport system substrate-binding protein